MHLIAATFILENDARSLCSHLRSKGYTSADATISMPDEMWLVTINANGLSLTEIPELNAFVSGFVAGLGNGRGRAGG